MMCETIKSMTSHLYFMRTLTIFYDQRILHSPKQLLKKALPVSLFYLSTAIFTWLYYSRANMQGNR